MDAYIIDNDPGLRKEKREMDDPAGKKPLIPTPHAEFEIAFFFKGPKTCAHPFQLEIK